jgi:hypothetical protein
MRLLVFAPLFAAGCLVSASTGPGRTSGGPPPPPPSGGEGPRIITGMVTDAETGKPLPKAAIDINSPALPDKMTVQTDDSGHYTTAPIPVGEFNVRCRRSGYDVVIRSVRVDRGTAVLDCALPPLKR